MPNAEKKEEVLNFNIKQLAEGFDVPVDGPRAQSCYGGKHGFLHPETNDGLAV